MFFLFFFSGTATKVELKVPLSGNVPTQVVPAKCPEISSMFGMPPVVTEASREAREPCHSAAHLADGQQLFQPQPVKPPSPPPKPRPAYSHEVGSISELSLSQTLFGMWQTH